MSTTKTPPAGVIHDTAEFLSELLDKSDDAEAIDLLVNHGPKIEARLRGIVAYVAYLDGRERERPRK